MRDIQYPLLSLKAVTSVYIGRTKEKKVKYCEFPNGYWRRGATSSVFIEVIFHQERYAFVSICQHNYYNRQRCRTIGEPLLVTLAQKR